ncbi:MAG: hypothetical protein ACF8LL_10700, partial [Phycisphaerales bacterium]
CALPIWALDQALLDAYSKLLANGNEQVRFGIASLTARLDPVELRGEDLEQYQGTYTDREFKVDQGRLIYRRKGLSDFRPLTCVGEDQFVIDGFEGFILRFDRDQGGASASVTGHYVQGHTDNSPRTEPEG